jgi:hypothetical protein
MADKAIEKGRTERYLPKAAWAKVSNSLLIPIRLKKQAALLEWRNGREVKADGS